MDRLSRFSRRSRASSSGQRESRVAGGRATYALVRQLGAGSQGSVSVIRRSTDSRLLVLKRCRNSAEARREVQILEQLRHPFIVRVHEHFVDEISSQLCIVMDYAAGGDLQQLLDRLKASGGSLSDEQVTRVLVQLCMAISHCHRLHVVHRDIKPANVFLTRSGANDFLAFLGDFGVSRVLERDDPEASPGTRARRQTIAGTPYYLAPEIVAGEPYSAKSDVWSLGVLLYQLLTIKLPFEARSLPELARLITEAEPAMPAKRDAQLLQAPRSCRDTPEMQPR